jgi:hypothetical protein
VVCTHLYKLVKGKEMRECNSGPAELCVYGCIEMLLEMMDCGSTGEEDATIYT